jgi:hypothetical protein
MSLTPTASVSLIPHFFLQKIKTEISKKYTGFIWAKKFFSKNFFDLIAKQILWDL